MLSDTIKNIPLLKDVLDIAYEITKLIKKSPKREAEFRKKQAEIVGQMEHNLHVDDIDSPTLKILCPTRWTIRAASLSDILKNYGTLMKLWDWSQDNVSDSDMKARIIGVQTKMQSFSFFYGLQLAILVLSHSDNLSTSLQRAELCAVDAQQNAKLSVTVLRGIRTDRDASLLWTKVTQAAAKLELQKPSLPRRHKMPSRYSEGNAQPEHHSNVDDFYRQIYFETVETVASCIEEHFNQKDYTMYANCEQVLVKGALGKLDSQKVDQLCEFYTEFNPDTLRIQLSIMAECYHSFNQGEGVDTLHSVIDFLRKNSKIWSLIPEVLSLTKIVLVMPATNASSERAFSALRRVKSYLRTTMSNNDMHST